MSDDPVPPNDSRRVRLRRGMTVPLTISLAVVLALKLSSPLAAPDRLVHLKDIEFHPAKIKAESGESIEFINDDPFEHDVYIVDAANPNRVIHPATLLQPGESVSLSVDEKAVFLVYCTIHGGMQGKLTTTGSFELSPEQEKQAAHAVTLPPIVKEGEALFWGAAMCHQCHQLGERGTGLRGPNLQNIGFRAAAQANRLGLESGTEYIVQSILEPDRYIVAGYSNDMARVYNPPIDLDQEQLKAIISYLQSQGGEVDTWAIDIPDGVLDPPLPYNPFADGDLNRGKEIFSDAGCGSCHQVGDRRPISVGPDLTDIGAFRDWTWLARSLLDPEAEIGASLKSATITLKSGETRTGILQKRTAKQVQMLLSQNRVEIIPAGDVAKIEIEEGTRMPGNYGELLTFNEIADLMVYLQSLKGAAANRGQ